MSTLLLDASTWDLLLDVQGNIAVADDPYALAQDAASAIKTFLGEVYFDTTIGVPLLTEILSKNPPVGLLKERLVAAALTVPGVASAKVFLSALDNRVITGQVQVQSATTGETSATNFAVVNPQGSSQ